jgi:CBS domain-containing protein
LAGDNNLLLSSVEEGLTVGLISTFDLRCCNVDDDLKDVVSHQELREFDYVPVKEGNEIIGLLHRVTHDTEDVTGRVRDVMCPLRGDLIVSADTGILSYIQGADERPCRLVLRGSRLDGIVTLSDLQRLPTRPALFLLVTHVELLMAQWVRLSRGSSEERILPVLSSKRRKAVKEKWTRLQRNDLALDVLSATEFKDKRTLLLCSELPFGDAAAAETDLEVVEDLRLSVAHAGDYALSIENALKTVKAVQTARLWIDRLQSAIEEHGVANGTS